MCHETIARFNCKNESSGFLLFRKAHNPRYVNVKVLLFCTATIASRRKRKVLLTSNLQNPQQSSFIRVSRSRDYHTYVHASIA